MLLGSAIKSVLILALLARVLDVIQHYNYRLYKNTAVTNHMLQQENDFTKFILLQ